MIGKVVFRPASVGTKNVFYRDAQGQLWMGYKAKLPQGPAPESSWRKCNNCKSDHLSGFVTKKQGDVLTVCIGCGVVVEDEAVTADAA